MVCLCDLVEGLAQSSKKEETAGVAVGEESETQGRDLGFATAFRRLMLS